MPARLLSLRVSSLHLSFSGTLSGSLFFACFCTLVRLGLRFLSPKPRPLPCPNLSNPQALIWRSDLPLAGSKLPPLPSSLPTPAGPLHSHKVWLRHCRGRGRPGPAQLCPRPARPRPRPPDKPLSDSSSGFKSLGPACRTAPLAAPARPVCSSVPLPRDLSEQPLHLRAKVRLWP